MKGEEDTGIPQFSSLEEEKAYWEARGPLAEGRRGRTNRPGPSQRRSSFLAVRLTGEELTRLRDIAANQGIGTSTFARLVLTSVIEHEAKLLGSQNRAKEAAQASLANPTFSSVKGAKGVLLNITAGKDFSLHEFKAALEVVQQAVDPDATILFGVVYDPKMAKDCRITLIPADSTASIPCGPPTGETTLESG